MKTEQIRNLIVRAHMNLSLGRYKEARKNFEEILLLDPKDLGAQAELISFLYIDGQVEDSFVAAKEMIEKHPNCYEGYLCLGILYYRERDLENASQNLIRSGSLTEEPIQKSFIEMFQYLCEGRYEEMLLRVQELRNIGIKHASVSLFSALVKIAWERDESAVKDINELIDSHPHLDAAYKLRGVIKVGLGDWAGAEKDFTIAINCPSIRNDGDELLLYRGICRIQLGEPLNALEDLSNLTKKDEDNGVALYYKATSHLMLGEFNAGMQDITNSINQCENRNSESLTLRGQLYFGLDKLEFAWNDLKEAISLNPQNGIAHSLMGAVLFKQNRFDDAIIESELGYSLEPNHAISQFCYVFVELSRKNVVKARIHLKKAKEYGLAIDETVINNLLSDISVVESQISNGTEISIAENVFRQKGDVWEIRFNNGDINFAKNLLGMNYIAKVLETPRESIPCELFSISSVDTFSSKEITDAGLRKDLGKPEYLIENYSKKDIERIRQLKTDIEDAIEEDTQEGKMIAEECENEIEMIMKKIDRNKRPEVSANDKRRAWAVSKAIKKSIENLYQYDEDLARHLEVSIEKGNFVCYNPSKEIKWTLS